MIRLREVLAENAVDDAPLAADTSSVLTPQGRDADQSELTYVDLELLHVCAAVS
jgi:hypothetical protein